MSKQLILEHERLKQYCIDLETQNTSFGLCLSALVLKHGRPIEIEKDGEIALTGDQEYIFRLSDFEATSNTKLTIETLPDIEGEAGTLVQVFKPKEEVVNTDGKEA